MSDLIARTARLVPYSRRPKHAASFVTAYIYEPAADEAGARLGNLYVVVEVLISGRASEEVVDLVIQTAGDKYYNESNTELDPLTRFEAAIKQTNHELSEYVGRGNASWIGKLSAIIAVQTGSELHVAQTGSAEAFLYRGKAVSRITVTETTRPATPSKTFGSIATGALEAGDKLILATPALIHQIPLQKLQSVVSSTSPNTTIHELSQLLEGTETTRIAAIVVEVTTPELAALKVRSEEPDDIELGNNESIAESALKTAAPIAQATAAHSQKAVRAAAGVWGSTKPKLRAGGLAAAEKLRSLLATSKGRRIAIVAMAAVIVIGIISVTIARSNAAGTKAFEQYQSLFQQYTTATAQAASGNTAAARATLVGIQTELKALAPQTARIENQLKNNPLAEGEPTTVAAFQVLVTDKIDVIDGLIKVHPTTLAEIGGKSGKPTYFETDGTKAYVIDSANHNTISTVSLATGTQSDSPADTSGLGDVVDTTLSSGNDGMFILTAKPSVWFYRFTGGTLTEQTVSYGSWEKATAIASYGPNLYLLGDNMVYKHVKSAAGYSPKSDYIATTGASAGATGLAVDGWVYLAAKAGLSRYLGPTLKQTVATPASLGTITNLSSVANGDYVLGVSASSNRIGLWDTKADLVKFNLQVALQDGKSLRDATYDAKLGKGFATVDNKLVSFPVKP